MKIIIALLTLLSIPFSMAEEKPLWEVGVGLAGLHHPHYLGANQESAYVLPLPYFVYRGKVISADRNGIRGAIYDSERLDLGISLSAALPVNSRDNDAREGMDDLDWMLEVGPTLQYQIYKDDKHLLRADWPLRGAVTVGDEFLNHQGWTTNPRLLHVTDIGQWTVTTNLGVVYSDNRYHGYIYNVDQADITSERSFYQASSGYTGARFSIGGKRRIGDYVIGANLRYYNLDGAVNDNSPLMKQQDYFAVSFIVAWMFSKSKVTAKTESKIKVKN